MRRAFTLVQAVLILVSLAIIAAVLFSIFGRAPVNIGRSSCQSKVKQIALGFKQYIQDYDEKYPPVSAGKEGWVDLVQPYLRSDSIFQCLTGKPSSAVASTDYFYNARLAGRSEASLTMINVTILIGDGEGQASSNAHLIELPFTWKTDAQSPAKRHLDGANYAYADAHVKWLKPRSVTSNPVKPNTSTFAID